MKFVYHLLLRNDGLLIYWPITSWYSMRVEHIDRSYASYSLHNTGQI